MKPALWKRLAKSSKVKLSQLIQFYRLSNRLRLLDLAAEQIGLIVTLLEGMVLALQLGDNAPDNPHGIIFFIGILIPTGFSNVLILQMAFKRDRSLTTRALRELIRLPEYRNSWLAVRREDPLTAQRIENLS